MTGAYVGRQAVVIGAGMAGLAAAGALAGLFEEVTVLERDRLANDAKPRQGVPQGRHLHGLLAGGLEALCVLFPEIECRLAAAGAVRARISSDIREEIGGCAKPRRDFGLTGSVQSRPLIERVTREAVERLPNVVIQSNRRVLAISASPDGARVTGVRCTASGNATQALNADLVVDASGRGGLTMSLLQSLDRPAPMEVEIGVDLGYATATFAAPKGEPREWLAVLTHPDPPHNSRAGVLSVIEDDLWMVTLFGRGEEQPPVDLGGFLAHARRLGSPTIYNAIKDLQPIGEIAPFIFPASVRRYFDLATLPDRLIVMGDALCRFNPMYGQGMSVAACEAVHLKALIEFSADQRRALDGIGRRFLVEAQNIIEAPWQMAAVPDFIYPSTRGRQPDDFAQTIAYAGALNRLAVKDPEVDRLMTEVWHLLRPPSVYQEPDLVAQVQAEIAAQAAA